MNPSAKSFVTLISLLLCYKVTFNESITIEPDYPKTGLSLIPQNITNLQVSTKYLAYKFNLSSLEYVLTSYSNLKDVCRENKTLTSIFQNEVEHNTLWNKTGLSIKVDKNDISEIKVDFIYNRILDSKIDSFNLRLNRSSTCSTFQELVKFYVITNRILNGMARGNISIILDIFNEDFILSDLRRNLMNYSQVSHEPFHPFDTSDYFPSNFFDFVDIKYHYENYQVSVLLSLPLYKSFMLYKIFPKPLASKYATYIINTHMKYVFMYGNETEFFTGENFSRNCFVFNDKRFCKRVRNIAICEDRALNRLEPGYECLKRLPRKNMITQIGRNTYFAIHSPMMIQINCSRGKFLIQMTDNTRIIDNYECSLNKSDFVYNPNHLGFYKIYMIEEENLTFFKYDEYGFEGYFELIWNIIGFISLILCLVNVFKYSKKKIMTRFMKKTYL